MTTRSARYPLWGICVVSILAAANVAVAAPTPFTVWTDETPALLPGWVWGWMVFMAVAFLTGLLFVRRHADARWVVAAYVGSHVFAYGMRAILGPDWLTLGQAALNHVLFWTPAAVYLALRIRSVKLKTAFGAWSLMILGTMAFSLFFDFRDAAIYLLD